MNTKRLLPICGLLALLMLATSPLQAAEYQIDPAHTTVRFQIKHLTISKVNGTFGDVSGTFSFTPGAADSWQAAATIGTGSIDTGNKKRDDHLRSPEFFDATQFPTMTFRSTNVTMSNDNTGVLRGELTMHGVTREVSLQLEYNGTVQDPWGHERAGFSATGKLNRKEWGLTYNSTIESGGLLIGENVKITLEVEGTKIQ